MLTYCFLISGETLTRLLPASSVAFRALVAPRVALFAHHGRDGIIGGYVIYYLHGLSRARNE